MKYRLKKFGYLVLAGMEILVKDGIGSLLKKGFSYTRMHYTPKKVLKLWKCRLLGITKVTREVMGSVMELDLTDSGINTDLFLDGIREVESTRELQTRLRPKWTVVDIGANIGYYVLQEAKVCTRVYAIEPDPSNYRMLIRNIKLNDYRNITTMNLAIGNEAGKICLKSDLISNATRICRDGEEPYAEVEMKTLDSLFPETKVDFVRMDVEGYEFNILQGMREIIDKYRPSMFIEVHRHPLRSYGHSQEQLLELLADYGYSITALDAYGKCNTTGLISNLLEDKRDREIVTRRGIAPRFFFDYI